MTKLERDWFWFGWASCSAVMAVLMLLVTLVSCSRPAPKCPTPPPVTVIAPRVPCDLPAIPAPFGAAIGFPSPDGQSIYVSKTEWANLGGYLMGISEWVIAVRDCIGAAP